MTPRNNRRPALFRQPAEPAPRASGRLHPLLTGAAISVIVLSAVGVGVMTGLIPSPLARTAPEVAAVEDAPAPAKAAVASSQERARSFGSAPVPVRQAVAARCGDCGVVQSVRSYKVAGQGSAVGVVGGGVLGGVVGNQFGGGNGRTALTVLGALGGAYAGNQIEKQVRSTTRYEMTVRMDDGSVRTLRSASPYNWNSGDAVRVVDGNVVSNARSDSGARAVQVSG